MEGSFQLILDEVVEVRPLDSDHGTGQLLLGDGCNGHYNREPDLGD